MKTKNERRPITTLLALFLILPFLAFMTGCSGSTGQEFDPDAPECSNNIDDDDDGFSDRDDIGCIDQTGAYEAEDNYEATKQRVEEIRNLGKSHIFISGAEGERQERIGFDDGILSQIYPALVLYTVEFQVRLIEGADPAGFALKLQSTHTGQDEPSLTVVSDVMAEGDTSTDWQTYKVEFGPDDFPDDESPGYSTILHLVHASEVRGESFTDGADGYEFKHDDMPHAPTTTTTGVWEPEEMPNY